MEKKQSIEELLYEEEGTTLDFKREQYPLSSDNDFQKSEILKDVLAFANAWRRVDAYILIGVEEVKGGRSRVVGIKEELDDANLQQFVNSKTQRPVEFHYSTVLIDGKKVGVIRIPVQTRPLFLEKDYGKVKRRKVYIRRGSSTDEADPVEVFDMGKAEIQQSQELPNLSFEFADLEKRSSLGKKINYEPTVLSVQPDGEIPDYEDVNSRGPFGIQLMTGYPNKNFYRELVNYYYVSNQSKELGFVLKNESSSAISDIRVELIARKKGPTAFSFFKSGDFPSIPRSRTDFIRDIKPLALQISEQSRRSIEVQDLGDHYRVEIPFKKAQPKQTVFSTDTIFIAATDSFVADIEITIYADNVPVPIKQMLEISCIATRAGGSLKEVAGLHAKYVEDNY